MTGCTQRVAIVKATPEKKSPPPGYTADPAADTLLKEGMMIFRQGEYERARRYFELALQKGTDDWQAYYYLGLIYSKRNSHAQAMDNFTASLAYAPYDKRTRSRIYVAMGQTWEKQGKFGQAKLNYITALNLYPKSEPAEDGLKRVEEHFRQSAR